MFRVTFLVLFSSLWNEPFSLNTYRWLPLLCELSYCDFSLALALLFTFYGSVTALEREPELSDGSNTNHSDRANQWFTICNQLSNRRISWTVSLWRHVQSLFSLLIYNIWNIQQIASLRLCSRWFQWMIVSCNLFLSLTLSTCCLQVYRLSGKCFQLQIHSNKQKLLRKIDPYASHKLHVRIIHPNRIDVSEKHQIILV